MYLFCMFDLKKYSRIKLRFKFFSKNTSILLKQRFFIIDLKLGNILH